MRTLLGFPQVEPGYPPGSVLNRNYAGLEWLDVGASCASRSTRTRARSCPIAAARAASATFRSPTCTTTGSRSRRSRAGSCSWARPRRGSSTCGRRRWGPAYPGVEVHANLIAGMLDGNIKARPAYVLGAEVILLLVGGLTLAIWLPFLSPFRATAVSVAALVLITGLSIGVWLHADLVLPLAASLLMTIGLFALNMSYGYFVETAVQARADRALRRVRAARAGRRDGARSGEVQHGGQGRGPHGALHRHPRGSPRSPRASTRRRCRRS